MEQNESKCSLTPKQAPYSFVAVNLGQNSPCNENLSLNSTASNPALFPFSISNTTTTSRLIPNPNFSPSPGHNDESTTDDFTKDRSSNERRLKRMISNRESARRSRMRRKMQVEELQYLVSELQATNRQLSEKLIQILDCNQQILQENSQLKEKVSSLQMVLADFLLPLRNVGEDHINNNDSSVDVRVIRAQEVLHNR